jgi:magnesium transporter
MPHVLFGPELREMIETRDEAGLRAFCESMHPATVAEAVDDMAPEQIWEVISQSDIRTQASIFEYLPVAKQVDMLEVARPQVGKLIEKMSHDDRVDLIRKLPSRVSERLLRLVDEADRRDISALFTYGENTVGSLMTTDYAWLPPTLTAAEAVDQLRTQAPDKETIYYIYVLDEAKRRADGGVAPRRLLGVISLRDLILAPRFTLVRDLMETDLVTLKIDDKKETAAEMLARYDFIALAVVDSDGGMVGIVTHDDVIDVLREEATEDLQKQAGVSPIAEGFLDARFQDVWQSRVKWLVILFILQMVTVYVMAKYEEKISISKALIACLPLVLSVGGNAGSQAATLIVRALALHQVSPSMWVRVLGREVLMGMALATPLGVLALFRTYFLTPGSLYDSTGELISLTWVLGAAVTLTCLWGTLLGCVLPLFFKRVGFDPALISSPAIATLSDVSGIIIFAYVAAVFF